MTNEPNSKIALVTGASQGIGKAIAAQLVNDGYTVYIAARNLERITETAEAIGAKPIVCDVSSVVELQKMFSELPPLDIVICNAGGPPPGLLENITDEQWQHAFELTFMSVVRIMRAVLPHMQKQRWGRIVCLTSTSVKQPIDSLVTSNSLRAAVTNLVKTISTQVAKDQVTVNVVAPGMIETDRLKELMAADPQFGQRLNAIPMGHLGSPEDIAHLVSFLVSEKAGYITGSQFTADGGLTHSLL